MHVGSLQDTCRMEQGYNIKQSDATCRMALVQEKLAQQAQRTQKKKKKASHASKKNGQGGITELAAGQLHLADSRSLSKSLQGLLKTTGFSSGCSLSVYSVFKRNKLNTHANHATHRHTHTNPKITLQIITVIIRNKKESSKKNKKAYQAKKINVFISTKSLFFPGRCGHQNHFVPTKASHTSLQT